MFAYFISFLLLGLPICWAEWTMGRYAGQKGVNSCPGILMAIANKPKVKYLGIIGIIMPIIIYSYYVYIEGWCLGYAVNFATDSINFQTAGEAQSFFADFIGAHKDGSALGFGFQQVGGYLLIVFILNFVLIYRGLAKGIELFCTYAMPTLIGVAAIILIRVLTLGSPPGTAPEENVKNGLGFMWNPQKIYLERLDENGKWEHVREYVDAEAIAAKEKEISGNPELRMHTVGIGTQLRNPQLWLAAASQSFYSLSAGLGIILTYASYLSKRDDVLLSGLAATSASEFCQVVFGGLITLPAAVAFLGVASVAGMGTFGLGFNVLPLVFSEMTFGPFFGFLFFFLLFLAAVTSSLSLLQPPIAFLEETLNINRKRSVAILGLITAVCTLFVMYFSKDQKALETMNFWTGELLIFILATTHIILFGWVFGIDRGFKEAHSGSVIRIPKAFKIIMKYICPIFSLSVFISWIVMNVFGIQLDGQSRGMNENIKNLFVTPDPVAWMSIILIILVGIFSAIIIGQAPLYKKICPETKTGDSR